MKQFGRLVCTHHRRRSDYSYNSNCSITIIAKRDGRQLPLASLRLKIGFLVFCLSLFFASSNALAQVMDFGDAPAPPYPTLMATDGARHVIVPGVFLGQVEDGELDGQPDTLALGDDNDGNDDDDGVMIMSPLVPGEMATIVVVASIPVGYLNAWIDFDGNGEWDEAEKVCPGLPVIAGDNELIIPVPTEAAPGPTFARFRFSPVPVLNPFGEAPDGEVEDYELTIENIPPVSDPNGPYVLETGGDLVLDGTGSADPNEPADSIVSYEWDLDDDGQFDNAIGATPTVPWATIVSLGLQYPANPLTGLPTNTVGLRVTDSFGASDSSTTTLTIYDNQPYAGITANPNPAACGQTISFSGSSSYHGHPGRSIVQYEWDFDYGGTFSADAAGVSVNHAYNQFGSYTAALRVTDDNVPAKTDMDTVVVDVSQGNHSPVADSNGPYVSNVGHDVPLDGSGSSDPNAGCGDSIVSYAWDLDDDGQFDDAIGATPTIPWSDIYFLGLAYPADLATGLPTNTIRLRVTDSFGVSSTDSATLTIYGYDYGDAPDPPYSTIHTSNGARHAIVPGVFLGQGVDADSDGHADASALGDDSSGIDDEDGIVFTSQIVAGMTASIQVIASAAGVLNGWVDFSGNGSWLDAGEQVFTNQPVAAGTNNLTFSVPAGATTGETFSRFRFSSSGGLLPTDWALDGEVEDYRVEIACSTVFYRDADSDGFGDPGDSRYACTQPEGYVSDNTDCDDTDGLEYPGQTWYADLDGDGFGDPGSSHACDRADPTDVTNDTDCDDRDSSVNPGRREGPEGASVCSDGKDNDCDNLIDAADRGCTSTGIPWLPLLLQ